MELRQKGKKFEHVVNNPTQGDLVSLLGQSLVGSALTAIFVCVSQVNAQLFQQIYDMNSNMARNPWVYFLYLQAPANAQQSRHALEFGETFSRLTMDRIRPMPSGKSSF